MISHIACVMDGNRRWARSRGMPAFMGHREGAKAIEKIAKYCLDNAIKHLSLYTFSIENLGRSEEEKSFLFNLLVEQAEAQLSKFLEYGIKVHFVGDRSLFLPQVKEACERLEQKTAGQDKLILNFLFCYGGQQEILAACKKAIQAVKNGDLKENDLTVEWIMKNLWSSHNPPPEMIIRTGGKHRLSNFLLYQSAYSELFFTDTYWPDFSPEELDKMVKEYGKIKRNFGQG